MGNKDYLEKLKDPRWQQKRLKIMERDGFQCKKCGDDKSTLHVHHKNYVNGKDPWDYDDNILITLCDKCHEYEHKFIDKSLGLLDDQIRNKLLSFDIINIGLGFRYGRVNDISSPFIGNAFRFALENPLVMDLIVELFVAFCYEQASKKGDQILKKDSTLSFYELGQESDDLQDNLLTIIDMVKDLSYKYKRIKNG